MQHDVNNGAVFPLFDRFIDHCLAMGNIVSLKQEIAAPQSRVSSSGRKYFIRPLVWICVRFTIMLPGNGLFP